MEQKYIIYINKDVNYLIKKLNNYCHIHIMDHIIYCVNKNLQIHLQC